jgi:hypothetical protein
MTYNHVGKETSLDSSENRGEVSLRPKYPWMGSTPTITTN